ncbi:phosphate/phosphite/phosphonate ABC transporter substrate-binding protein [Amphritea sp.]|uniref:phosphate/phosphite/phosphonate ABC transporter substrate-binding protein n=1 Tax=Amphritea sp. TaxID=1872502 RepID=UPI003A8D2F84
MRFSTLMAICVFCTTSVSAAAETLSFGIVPQQSAQKLAHLWTPITDYLSAKTGYQIRFTTAKDIPTFERRLHAGLYDIAYMNPYHFTVFNQKPGYRAIARQKDKRIKGIVVVRKDSLINSLMDLNGTKMAFPSPAAFAASVIPQSRLKQDHIEFSPSYVSSHDSVYLGVARGFFQAGGGVLRTFNNTTPAIREQLRILWTSEGYTPHAVAVAPSISTKQQQRIREALLGMVDDPQGIKLLNSIRFNEFTAAENADWDDVRSLNITLLDHLLAD